MTDPENSQSVNAFARLCRLLGESWPAARWRQVTVLIAVSGGADSMALLRTLVEVKRVAQGDGRLIVAHYHHGLRGEEADHDQACVKQTAQRFGLDCQTERWRPPAGRTGNGELPPADEATMRTERYAFLTRTAHRLGARYVATAHTLDDNVETMLHHLFRGTGPAGLAGMPAHRDLATDLLLVRPFLSVDRQTVREALQAIGQDWREDDSNQDARWKRNWIRHTLLPQIETQYPQATQRIGSALASQAKMISLLDKLAECWIDTHCQIETLPADDRDVQQLQITGPATPLPSEQSSVVIHALRKLWDRLGWPRGGMREEHWQRLWQALHEGRPSTFMLPGTVRVHRGDDGWVITRRPGT